MKNVNIKILSATQLSGLILFYTSTGMKC